MKSFYILIVLALLFTGCSSTDRPEKSNLTVGVVKQSIVEGQTTQADLMSTFGSPNLISRNADGEEVWAYNRMSFQSNDESGAFTLILVGKSKATSSKSSKSFDLILTFDKNDVVKDYKVIYAAY